MILVTGASGLVGANLVRALLMQGQPVRAMIHSDQRALQGLEVDIVQADLRDPDSLRRAFQGVDVVYHLAAMISLEMDTWKQVESTNVQGTRHVVEASLRAGVRRFVYFSSIHALQQEPLDLPVDESRPLADGLEFPPYDRSKALAERAVQAGIARGLEAVILYPTAMLGPYDYKPSYLGRAVHMLAHGRIPALVQGGFDWVDVRDVVNAAIRAANTADNGQRYLLGGHWHSIREMAEMVAAVSGRRAPLLTVPMWLAYATAPLMRLLAFNGSSPIYTRVTLRALNSNHHISHAKAAQALDYQPRPFHQTIADTVAWFEQQKHKRENQT